MSVRYNMGVAMGAVSKSPANLALLSFLCPLFLYESVGENANDYGHRGVGFFCNRWTAVFRGLEGGFMKPSTWFFRYKFGNGKNNLTKNK